MAAGMGTEVLQADYRGWVHGSRGNKAEASGSASTPGLNSGWMLFGAVLSHPTRDDEIQDGATCGGGAVALARLIDGGLHLLCLLHTRLVG